MPWLEAWVDYHRIVHQLPGMLLRRWFEALVKLLLQKEILQLLHLRVDFNQINHQLVVLSF